VTSPSSNHDFAVDDSGDTPRLNMDDSIKNDSIKTPDSNRMSVSSMYSLSSARAGGGTASIASANGSEVGTPNTRTPSGAAKALGISHPETSTSAVSITTSSSNQYGGGQGGNNYQLTPRDTLSGTDMVKRNATTRNEGTHRVPQQPARDRSRAKRRFSGSTTGQSSHSPSSDRGLLPKKDEAIGPYCWGIIGVCALDVKARSKPSRNILNKLISKGVRCLKLNKNHLCCYCRLPLLVCLI
jgi:inositol hexakisphosphate/diphosphoinositol-pentakisphosphate kinase